MFPVAALTALWYCADIFLKRQETEIGDVVPAPMGIATQARTQPNRIAPITGGIVLIADPLGHFRGTVLINNVPMPFLLDTGATRTVIPIAMAIKASLPFGDIVLSNTAGGKVADRSTQIASLALGNAVLRNLDAQINEHLDEVLIGMNALKYFQMTQTGNTLALVVNNPADHRIETLP